MSITLPIQQAVVLHRQGNLAGAERLYLGLLAASPVNFNLLQLLGTVCAQQQRYTEAVDYLQRAIAIDASMASTHGNLANALHSLGRHKEAVSSYDIALSMEPDSADFHYRRGNLLKVLKQPDEALQAYSQTLELQPAHSDAMYEKGKLLLELRSYQQAFALFEATLVLKTNHVGAMCNKGLALLQLREMDAAIAAFEMALSLQPHSLSLLKNLFHAFVQAKRFDEAIIVGERVLALDDNPGYLPGLILLCRQSIGDWSGHDKTVANIISQVMAGRPVCLPYALQMFCSDPVAELQCARSFCQLQLGNMPVPLWQGQRYQHRKIRVAYLSADFHAHATAYLMAELFELHDQEHFEWFAFSFGPKSTDSMRTRVERAFHHFEDVSGLTDLAVAQRLRHQEIDIAVDLKGHTRYARPGILAHRPAPIQVNYLGYPGSTGMACMDYVLLDPVLVEPGEEHYYSEQVVRLPDSYQVNDSKRQHGMPCPDRIAVGLPASGFVFCCFNNSLKILPEVFSVWMRLLLAVEGSVLWLLQGTPQLEVNLRREAQARGVDPDRLIFAPRCRLQEHLARHQCADLFLDTLPYNAHTTASDALWSGLPLLTCKGRTFASRVAASLLRAIDLPELITDNLYEYERLALQLALSPAHLDAIRRKLAVNRLTKPLFDTARFARNMEVAYRHMQERIENGLPPAGFDVSRQVMHTWVPTLGNADVSKET